MFQKAVEELDVANVPQETPFASRTSVDDVQGDDTDSAKSSKDAGDDATDENSLYHVLTSFHNEYFMNFYEIRFTNSLGIHAS